jgi:23S rRNA pseudouridine955/2504/2580 synthase
MPNTPDTANDNEHGDDALGAPDAVAAPKPKPVSTIRVVAQDDGMRVDRWFKLHFPDVGFGFLQKLLRSGQVRVEGKRIEQNFRLETGQEVRVPHTARGKSKAYEPPTATSTGASDRALIEGMMLYEDEHVFVLNKPFGLAVQGGSGTLRHIDGMLAGMIDRFCDRPRLVHRLDRDTTGVLLLAKHRDAASKLGRIFQTRSAAKTYWALVRGVPSPAQGKVEVALVKGENKHGDDRVRRARPGEQDEAMHATTHYSVIERLAHKASWVSLKPVTGRQHQLRAHMDILGNPIIGDPKYMRGEHGLMDAIPNQLHLHARRLMLPHPITGERLDVSAPLPAHMLKTWKMLGLDPNRFEDTE